MRIILEGVTGSGKSSVFKELRLKQIKLNTLVLSEYYTLRTFEKMANKSEYVFDQLLSFIELQDQLFFEAQLDKTSNGQQQKISVCFEGFHLNAYSRELISEDEFIRIDQRLKKLGFKTVFFELPETLLKKRCIEETLMYRKSGWKNYIEALGGNEKALKIFTERQLLMIEKLQGVAGEVLRIDTSEKDWEYYTKIILSMCEMRK